MGLIAGACGDTNEDAGIEIDRALVDVQVLTWANQTGLNQVDVDVWVARLERACVEGVWDDEVARALSAEFYAEDLPLVLPGTTATDEQAPQALWSMAVNVCREQFPEGEVDDGPPAPSG